MDDLNKTINAGPENNSLGQQFRSLQNLLFATLAALIILSGSINLYLLRQVSYARKDLDAIKPQITQLEADYQKVSEPLIKNFIGGLQNYAKTHPDIVPLLTKYNLTGTPAPGGPALPGAMPSGTPAPAPTVPKK